MNACLPAQQVVSGDETNALAWRLRRLGPGSWRERLVLTGCARLPASRCCAGVEGCVPQPAHHLGH
jgi:hypothetical protein